MPATFSATPSRSGATRSNQTRLSSGGGESGSVKLSSCTRAGAGVCDGAVIAGGSATSGRDCQRRVERAGAAARSAARAGHLDAVAVERGRAVGAAGDAREAGAALHALAAVRQRLAREGGGPVGGA